MAVSAFTTLRTKGQKKAKNVGQNSSSRAPSHVSMAPLHVIMAPSHVSMAPLHIRMATLHAQR